MSFTESEIEVIADHMRSAGFDIPQDWDADRLGLLATAVLEALEMCRANKAPNTEVTGLGREGTHDE